MEKRSERGSVLIGFKNINREGYMTKRNQFLEAKEEYKQALYALERKKPQGAVYKLCPDNGTDNGRMIYDPEDDSITINLPGVETKIPGAHLRSLYSALGNLVG
jgi:hypothetical protein